MQDFLDIALEYFRCGLHVIPIGENKRPFFPILKRYNNEWKIFMDSQTEADVRYLFSMNCYGIGIITGANGLECIDIDTKYDLTGTLIQDYNEVVCQLGGGASFFDTTREKSPSGGWHLVYRAPNVEATQDLAKRPCTDKESDEAREKAIHAAIKRAQEPVTWQKKELPKGWLEERMMKISKTDYHKPKTVIETRGIGGYFVAYPSPGYVLDHRSFLDVPTITAEQRDILINAARSLDSIPIEESAMPEVRQSIRNTNSEFVGGESPFEAFNKRGDIVNLLEMEGWTVVDNGHYKKQSKTYLRHPTATNETTGYVKHPENYFCNFSPNSGLPQKAISAVDVYMGINNKKDIKEVRKELMAMGYGSNGTMVKKPVNGNDTTQQSVAHPSPLPSIKAAQSESVHIKEDGQKTFDPAEVLKNSKFDILKPPPRMDYTFRIAGYDSFIGSERFFDVGSDGMLGIVMGEAKSRKTSLISAIVASGLSNGNTYLNCKLELPDKNIVFVDTEQPEQYFYKTQKKIHYMAGNSRNFENYHAFMLRDRSIEERKQVIEHIIQTIPDIGLFVIDGALDLILDMNSQTESQELAQKYLKWTSDSKALVLTVVHSAFGHSKAIGHIGSYLDRKCDFALETLKDKETQRTMVKPKRTRSMPFPPFEFTNNKDGYPTLHEDDEIQEPTDNFLHSSAKKEKAAIGFDPNWQPTPSPSIPQNGMTAPSNPNNVNITSQRMNTEDIIPF